MAGLVTEAMMSDAAMLGQLVHWKSRAVSLIRFCMLNGSRTALKPSSLIRRITFTMSARTMSRSSFSQHLKQKHCRSSYVGASSS